MCHLKESNSAEATDEMVALASGPSDTVLSYSACVVNGVKYVVKKRDIRRKTQNCGVRVPDVMNNSYYGQLEDILILNYINNCSVVLFKCKWFDADKMKKRIVHYKNINSVFVNVEKWKENPFILASQAEQVFYLDDPVKGRNWKIVQESNHRHV